jgi:hypothetical protein
MPSTDLLDARHEIQLRAEGGSMSEAMISDYPNPHIEYVQDATGVRMRAVCDFTDVYREAVRNMDEKFMAKAAPQFGYEQVTHCRDCKAYKPNVTPGDERPDFCMNFGIDMKDGSFFCAEPEPKEES